MPKTKMFILENQNIFKLIVLISSIFAALYWKFIFLHKTYIFADIGGDTIESYVPTYTQFIRDLKSFSFNLWDFNVGVGASKFAAVSHVFDVFLLPMLVFPTSKIYIGLVFSLYLKTLVTGIFFYKILCLYNIKDTKIKIVCSAVWAFNGFMVLWGQHYFFATFVAYFTIIMYGLELLLRKGKPYVFIFSIFLLAVQSVHEMIHITVFGAMYSIAHVLYYSNSSLKAVFLKLLNVICCYTLGLLLSMLSFLPQLIVLFESPEGGKPFSLNQISIYSFDIILQNIATFISNNFFGVGSSYFGYFNYYEKLQQSTSILLLLFCFIALAEIKGNSKKLRNLSIFIISIFILSTCTNIISYIFNLFQLPDNHRYTYTFSFIICLFGCLSLDSYLFSNSKQKFVEKTSTYFNEVLLTIIFIVSIYSMFLNTNNDLKYNLKLMLYVFLVWVLIVAYKYLISSYINNPGKRRIVSNVLMSMVIVEIVLLNYPTMNLRNFAEINHYFKDPSYKIVNEIKALDKEFYRIVNDNPLTAHNDSLLENYYGVTTYSSLNNRSYINFSSETGFQYWIGGKKIGFVHHNLADRRLLDFLGVKYFLQSHKESLNNTEIALADGNYHLLKNNDYYNFGTFYNKIINYDGISDYDPEVKRDILLDNAVVSIKNQNIVNANYKIEDNYKNLDYSFSRKSGVLVESQLNNKIAYVVEGTDPNVQVDLNISAQNDSFIEMIVECAKQQDIQIFWKDDKNEFSEANSTRIPVTAGKHKINVPIYINGSDTINSIRIDVGQPGEKINLSDIRIYERPNVTAMKSTKIPLNITSFKETKITGNIEISNNGMLVLTLPYDKGWHAIVNGVEQETIEVDFGMTGIYLKPGSYDIELYYKNFYFTIGIIISGITLFGIILYNLIINTKRKVGMKNFKGN
ncbi:YfhO family protein [Paenibacillus sedimenti]|uniref:YfhO family protein n=1 Tax=Paenibacillus sedimenti TaxID=2770274 RepID=A0A926QIJ9_9BACL|nr:YfhO family protein [Paenibacillus sedimenti]MBD0379693.1 YfhO family protein [Paenibacillus sedimenti]